MRVVTMELEALRAITCKHWARHPMGTVVRLPHQEDIQGEAKRFGRKEHGGN